MLGGSKALTFDDVLLVPGYNGIKSRQLVSTSVSIKNKEFKIPIVSSNMDTVTGVHMANLMGELGGLALLHRFVSIEQNCAMFKSCHYPEYTGVSIGIGPQGMERAEALVAAGASIVCVDVAHGHSKDVNRTVRMLRESFKDNILIIAGNVASYAGADYLASAGADMIKVGIGSGSVCTTRMKTGYGVPQLSAIMDCARVDRALIADGGIRFPCDAVKALAAGASMVMLGGLLAATDESPGECIEKINAQGEKQKLKVFRGMASKEAQEDFMGGMSEWKTAEGVSVELAHKGSARDVLMDVLGGIRSGLTYSGAESIKVLQRKAHFIEITQAGFIEGTPHAKLRS
jgi:IMP dehydrogenase